MKKRIMSLFSVFAMLCAFVPVISVQAAESISIGEYVQMGTYYSEPILWRCVDIDENGPLMLSDKIICIKPYDARTSENDTTGSHSRAGHRFTYGSNYWGDSNMRSWLNSNESAGNVTWLCGNLPDSSHVWNGYNEYDKEAGFLTNFSSEELKAIKEVSQKSILSAYDQSLDTTGASTYHTYNYSISDVVQNYDSCYAEYLTDKMFLLDVKQVNAVYNNGDMLGSDYYIGQPTAQCVANSEYTSSSLAAGENWYYWLRSPYGNYGMDGYPGTVRCVNYAGNVNDNNASDIHTGGVRPAFYLNAESASFASGSGTESDPYTIDDNTIKIMVDGKELFCDQPPVIINDRTLVPLRTIFEALGASVDWDENTRTVTAAKDGTTVSLTIDDATIYINGEAKALDTAAQLINGRTMVPARAAAEAFGCSVDWDGDNKTVIIKQ